jgi:hypothetical protein
MDIRIECFSMLSLYSCCVYCGMQPPPSMHQHSHGQTRDVGVPSWYHQCIIIRCVPATQLSARALTLHYCSVTHVLTGVLPSRRSCSTHVAQSQACRAHAAVIRTNWYDHFTCALPRTVRDSTLYRLMLCKFPAVPSTTALDRHQTRVIFHVS